MWASRCFESTDFQCHRKTFMLQAPTCCGRLPNEVRNSKYYKYLTFRAPENRSRNGLWIRNLSSWVRPWDVGYGRSKKHPRKGPPSLESTYPARLPKTRGPMPQSGPQLVESSPRLQASGLPSWARQLRRLTSAAPTPESFSTLAFLQFQVYPNNGHSTCGCMSYQATINQC